MAIKTVKYCVVDAFTGTACKGNPAAVCMLEENKDEEWLQSFVGEFNLPVTCFLTPIVNSNSGSENPRFRLRWFSPVTEVILCGHATLAASQYIFEYGLADSDIIEFLTLSGILIAKKVEETESSSPIINYQNGGIREGFSIELNFPVIPISEFYSAEVSLSAISKSLNGASVVEIHKTTTTDDHLVLLTSGREVMELQPQFDEIQKLPGRGMIVTGPAPSGSGFDFYSRFFYPKLGVDEASTRRGIIELHLDEKSQRVFLRGKAVVVAEGSLLV